MTTGHPDQPNNGSQPTNRMWDDDVTKYCSNVNPRDNNGNLKSDKILNKEVLNQPLVEVGTHDLLKELASRFQHFVCIGKRFIDDEVVGDRNDYRKNHKKVDNRYILKGDVHTVMGLIEWGKTHLGLCMQEGFDDIHYGFRDPNVDYEEISTHYEGINFFDEIEYLVEDDEDDGDEWQKV